MMSETEARKEALELLARGKISIDEAVELMAYARRNSINEENDAPIYKAEVSDQIVKDASIDDRGEKVPITEEVSSETSFEPEKEAKETVEIKMDREQPRWLRIRVNQLNSGKNKVSVNIPYGMVKFGLGVAQVFSPELKGVNLNEVGEMISRADSGLLVDVKDEESNEQVRIYFE